MKQELKSKTERIKLQQAIGEMDELLEAEKNKQKNIVHIAFLFLSVFLRMGEGREVQKGELRICWMVLGACVEGLMWAEEGRRLTGCSIDFHRLRDSTSPSLPSSGVRGEGEDVVVVEQEIGLCESLE